MRRVFKNRYFSRWMRKAGLGDAALAEAVSEMAQGLIDADLGGGLVKKRVPLPGRGKRGSTRTIIATNKGDRWFFLYGFEKNELGNIDPKQLLALQIVAGDLLVRMESDLDKLVQDGTLQEISHES